MQEELKIGVITESITFLYLTAATNSQCLLTKQLKFRTRLDFIISNYSQFYFYQRRKCEKENTFFSNPNPLSVCVPKTHVIFVTWRNLISWTIKMVQIKKYHIVILRSIFYCNCKQSAEIVCQRWSKICLLSRHSLFWAFLYETLALSFTEAYTVTFTKENNLLWCKGPWIWKNLSFYLINQIQEEALLHCTKYVLKLF